MEANSLVFKPICTIWGKRYGIASTNIAQILSIVNYSIPMMFSDGRIYQDNTQ